MLDYNTKQSNVITTMGGLIWIGKHDLLPLGEIV